MATPIHPLIRALASAAGIPVAEPYPALPANHPVLVAMRFAHHAHGQPGCSFAQSLHRPEDCPWCGLTYAIACLEGDTRRVRRFRERHPDLEHWTLQTPFAPATTTTPRGAR